MQSEKWKMPREWCRAQGVVPRLKTRVLKTSQKCEVAVLPVAWQARADHTHARIARARIAKLPGVRGSTNSIFTIKHAGAGSVDVGRVRDRARGKRTV